LQITLVNKNCDFVILFKLNFAQCQFVATFCRLTKIGS
jgi:hypothetical protein